MKWKALIPKSAYKMISWYRTFERNQVKSRQLDAQHSAQLQDRHLRNLKIVPCRKAILELMPRNAVVCEVGVAEAEFSRLILDITQPSKLHLIDLWSSDSERYADAIHTALARVQNEINSGLVEVHRGYSWDMLETLENESIDWVYLDAAHDYECIKKDLAAAVKKVRPGGMILGHDYTRWSSNGLNRWGVVEAVNEFCLERDWEMVYLSHETDRHCSFAIRAIREHA